MKLHRHLGLMWLARLGAGALLAVLVVWPLAAVLTQGPGTEGGEAPAAGGATVLALRTVGVAGLIALLATVAGLPGAWLVWRRGWAWAPLVAVPLFSPAYLVSSGLNILRAPATITGDWLGELSRGGTHWPTLLAGRVLAVVGLAIWASPLASLIVGAGLRTVDDETVDAMAMEAGRVRVGLGVLRCVRSFVIGAFGLITVMMLGSAVPLHLAQFRTVALLAWMTLLETGSVRGAAWACGPLIVAPAVVGVVVSWLVVRAPAPERMSAPAARERFGLPSWAALVWVLVPGVVLPVGLFASQLRSGQAIARFWVESGPAVVESGTVAAMVGGVCGVLALAVWRMRSNVMLGVLTFAFVVGALAPGVLVGCAWRLAWPEAWADSWWMVVLAHATRFGAAGVFGGVLLQRLDDESTRQLMAIDGVESVGPWWRASGVRLVGPWMMAVVVGAVLSFNEIEAAVVVQVAGAMSLPQRLLNDLHQLRMEAMSAAAMWMVAMGLGVALVTLLLQRSMVSQPKPGLPGSE